MNLPSVEDILTKVEDVLFTVRWRFGRRYKKWLKERGLRK